jgi:hypothetical protein
MVYFKVQTQNLRGMPDKNIGNNFLNYCGRLGRDSNSGGTVIIEPWRRVLYVRTRASTYWDGGAPEGLAIQQPADPSRRQGTRGFALQLLLLPRR